jgi:hypothetical protein
VWGTSSPVYLRDRCHEGMSPGMDKTQLPEKYHSQGLALSFPFEAEPVESRGCLSNSLMTCKRTIRRFCYRHWRQMLLSSIPHMSCALKLGARRRAIPCFQTRGIVCDASSDSVQ